MSVHWFDDITRHLTSGLRRREAVALMAGTLSTLLFSGPRPVEAGCKKVGKTCDKNKDCCDGAKCKKDKCKCKSGRKECGGKCYHLNRDEQHCGSCNTACVTDEGEFCLDGRCVNVPT